jgi:hypothetical protein
MDKRSFTIGILSLTAVLLFVAILIMPPRASANFAIKDRDYQAVTALINTNDEALYVLDNRSGQMACFSYSPAQRSLVLKGMRPVMDAFAAAANAAGGAGGTGGGGTGTGRTR